MLHFAATGSAILTCVFVEDDVFFFLLAWSTFENPTKFSDVFYGEIK